MSIIKEISVVEMNQEERDSINLYNVFFKMLEKKIIDESMVSVEFFSVEMEDKE